MPYDGGNGWSGLSEGHTVVSDVSPNRQSERLAVEDVYLDRWFRQSLHEEVGPATSEPLPMEWLTLIDGA